MPLGQRWPWATKNLLRDAEVALAQDRHEGAAVAVGDDRDIAVPAAQRRLVDNLRPARLVDLGSLEAALRAVAPPSGCHRRPPRAGNRRQPLPRRPESGAGAGERAHTVGKTRSSSFPRTADTAEFWRGSFFLFLPDLPASGQGFIPTISRGLKRES